MTEVEELGNGLIIQYERPKSGDKRDREIQLHFSYLTSFSPRKDTTISDIENATKGLLNSIEEIKKWINRHGMPSRIYGFTENHFLLRILEHCNFTVIRSQDDIRFWSFELNTKDLKPEDLISTLETGITNVLLLIQRLKEARN